MCRLLSPHNRRNLSIPHLCRGAAPEAVNSRAAMLGISFALIGELMGKGTIWQQARSRCHLAPLSHGAAGAAPFLTSMGIHGLRVSLRISAASLQALTSEVLTLSLVPFPCSSPAAGAD